MGRSVKYISPSTLKRSNRRLLNHLHKLLSQARHQVDESQAINSSKQIEAESKNELSQPRVETPQKKVSQPSKPMTLQDLKDYMSSARNEIQDERKKEYDQRRIEHAEDMEKRKLTLSLPP